MPDAMPDPAAAPSEEMPPTRPTGTESDAQPFDLESPEAKAAKAEALAHARAARAARARYARLTQSGELVDIGSMRGGRHEIESVNAQRINRMEAAFGAVAIAGQIRSSIPNDWKARPALEALTQYLPLLILKPEGGDGGVGGVIRDPRIWPIIFIGALSGGQIWIQQRA
jgi:hypothetical protein